MAEPPTPAPAWRGADGALLAALLAGVLLAHLPSLGRAELDHEEGRRALPAREMLEGGSWVEPRIFGRPYLAKPPLHYWTVAASAAALRSLGLDGAAAHLAHGPAQAARTLPPPESVSPRALRLPSVLAVAGTVAALFVLVRACATRLAAGVAAGSFAVAPHLWPKAVLGEMEALLTFVTFLGTALAWWGLRRGGSSTVFGGATLGAAVLVKGPIAWGFALPALALAAWRPERGERRAGGRFALVLGLSVVVPGLWLSGLLLERGGAQGLASRWSQELGRGGTGGLLVFSGDRLRFLVGAFAGWLPATLLLLAGLGAVRREPLGRFTLRVLGCGLLLLLCWPGVRARYGLPLLPWAAVGAGLAVQVADGRARTVARALGQLGLGLGLLGAVTLACWSRLRAAPEAKLEIDGALLSSAAIGAVIAGGALWFARRRIASLSLGGLLGAAALALLALRLGERLWLAPTEAHDHERLADAAVLVELTGPNASVAVGTWSHFNLLYATGWRPRWVEHSSEVEPDEWLLLQATQHPEPPDSFRLAFEDRGPALELAEPGRRLWLGNGEIELPGEHPDLRGLRLWQRLPEPGR